MKYSFYFYYLIIQIYKQLFEFIIKKILNLWYFKFKFLSNNTYTCMYI